MTFSTTVQAFAYSALKANANDKDAAIASLDAVLAGQYTTNTTSNGRVMTSASGEGKAFSYQLPENFGPKEITDITFQAIQFLNQYTLDEINVLLFRRRRNVALASFGGVCIPRFCP